MQVSVERKFDEILDSLDDEPDALSEAESKFSRGVAAKLDVALDQSLERDIRIKLAALETALTQDYIPGLGESTTQLTLMNEKANDIRSAIEVFSQDPGDIRRLGITLSHHRTYMLASAIKLYVQAERLRLAKASLGDKAAPVVDLKKSIQTLAKHTKDFLTHIETSILPTYAKARLLSHDYKVYDQREEFGFKQGLTYAYCVKSKAMAQRCGAPSKQICPNELSADCIAKAKKESIDAFTNAEVEKPFMDALRKDILDRSWDDVEKNLTKMSLHPQRGF
jgi:hypothetical protein